MTGRTRFRTHLGELHWGTDPTSDSRIPSPSATYEIDYYTNADLRLHTSNWTRGIEANYALYGYDINIVRDQTLSANFVDSHVTDSNNGFGFLEIRGIADLSDSGNNDENVLVLDRSGGNIPGGGDQTGINLWKLRHIALFTDGLSNEANSVDRATMPEYRYYDSPIEVVGAKTLIHEIGHGVNIGRADDAALQDTVGWGVEWPPISIDIDMIRQNWEIYTNTGDDPSQERLVSGPDARIWSIMGPGWDTQMSHTYNGSRYFAFSIQELFTANDYDEDRSLLQYLEEDIDI
ncbi:hypothetical protein [Salinarchaeum sp. Harcht-Bsk1]|uniref:hypothetical protein n=1 Tax=Salinarchaeum sp. Harcht-Bsk1 TaxID=1333523 RepID=UPI0011817A6E|nr:hypothetical protein [Salinarchaeum sp. Harcht-Bsk1]